MKDTLNENSAQTYWPKHDIDPKDKDKEWCLAYIKAFHVDRDKGGSLFYNNKGTYDNTLKYALGQQDIGQYKSMLGCEENESYMNTNWDIVPIMPKFIDVVVGNMQKQQFDITCNAIDPTSIDAETQAKHSLMADVFMQQTFAKVEGLTGIKAGGGPNQQANPQSFDEIDLHMSLNYKQKMAIDAEDAITYIHHLNGWEHISEQLSRDLVIYGVAATKDYIGSNGLPKVRRVDPRKFKTLYSKTPTFKGCEAFGEMVEMTAGEFQRKSGQEFDKAQKEEIYELFGRKGSGSSSNSLSDYSYGGLDDYRFGSAFDDIVIEIFEVEFSSVDTDYYETKDNQFGNTTSYKKPYGYKAPKDSKYKRKVQKDDYQIWYKGSWIIGTEDLIFDYGLATDQKIPNSSFSEAISSFHVVSPGMSDMNTQSLGERMIPSIDDYQTYKIKLRQAVAAARVKGMAIDIDGLDNIPSGKGSAVFKQTEVVSIYNETGNLYYRGKDDSGKDNGPPMTELENGMAVDVFRYVDLMNVELAALRDTIGINEVADGSTPNPDIGKAVAEMALQRSNNSLESLFTAHEFLYTETAYSLLLRMQEAVKTNKIEGYAKALGSTDAKFIKVNKDISLHEYGIIVEKRPSPMEWADYENKLTIALTEKQITIDHYWAAKNIKNIKLAQQYLAQSVKKKREMDQKIAEQASIINGEEQRKSNEQTVALETQKVSHVANEDIRKEMAKGEIQKEADERKFAHEIQLAKLNHHISADIDDNHHVNNRRTKKDERDHQNKQLEQTTLQPPLNASAA